MDFSVARQTFAEAGRLAFAHNDPFQARAAFSNVCKLEDFSFLRFVNEPNDRYN